MFAARADLEPVERKLLAKLAGKRSGAGLRTAETSLKEEDIRQKREGAEARRKRNTAKSTKARLSPPLPDAEAGPVMETWDEILCHVDVPESPMRDAEGYPVAIQCRETSGLHELTAQGANAGEEEETRLPSPNNFLLTKHDKFTLEIEIGDHITFVQETLNGERDVAPPDKFLIHYLKYSRSKLPRVQPPASAAVARQPRWPWQRWRRLALSRLQHHGPTTGKSGKKRSSLSSERGFLRSFGTISRADWQSRVRT